MFYLHIPSYSRMFTPHVSLVNYRAAMGISPKCSVGENLVIYADWLKFCINLFSRPRFGCLEPPLGCSWCLYDFSFRWTQWRKVMWCQCKFLEKQFRWRLARALAVPNHPRLIMDAGCLFVFEWLSAGRVCFYSVFFCILWTDHVARTWHDGEAGKLWSHERAGW